MRFIIIYNSRRKNILTLSISKITFDPRQTAKRVWYHCISLVKTVRNKYMKSEDLDRSNSKLDNLTSSLNSKFDIGRS